ncbi:MAG: hypothetical protein AB8B55_17130 [Mariniblastus sp.]
MSIDLSSNRFSSASHDLNGNWNHRPPLAVTPDLVRARQVQTTQHPNDNYFPTPDDIQAQCQAVQLVWDDRERELRRIRAQMACQFGVCRNV